MYFTTFDTEGRGEGVVDSDGDGRKGWRVMEGGGRGGSNEGGVMQGEVIKGEVMKGEVMKGGG